MIDGSQEGSTGAARPVPVGGGVHAPPGAPLLMSSTRLDALIGPLTPSVTDSASCGTLRSRLRIIFSCLPM
jgi:hypothetical protein